MKFIALISGGKDSFYAALQAIKCGHELVACLHLAAPIVEAEEEIEESYMYQTAASEVVKTLVEECLGVPLIFYPRLGKSVQTGLIYEHDSHDDSQGVTTSTTTTVSAGGSDSTSTLPPSPPVRPHDEVEDLFDALLIAKQRFGQSFEAVTSGAILSTYQRVRIENVCDRLGLTSLSYLWRLAPQDELLPKMIDDGIEAVLVKTACPPGLIPQKHLGKTLRSLWHSGLFTRLHDRYQFHVCGEGGEYESLVLDSPLHRKKLVIDRVEIIEEHGGDGVGELRILECHAEDKNDNDIPILEDVMLRDDNVNCEEMTTTPNTRKGRSSSKSSKERTAQTANSSCFSSLSLPYVFEGSGGLLHVSEIIAPVTSSGSNNINSEAHLAVEEALMIFSILERTLQSYGATARDVVFVHLYLSEISHFGFINEHYQSFFGSLLPPSRSCVSVGTGVLPGGRRVLFDCMVQIGSGDYMRSSESSFSPTSSASVDTNPHTNAAICTKTSKLRDVLHVQSISHWAPVCVGPYSQVNTIRSCIHFLAGQIGLVPATMTLRPTWVEQLEQCWTNVSAVLDALEGSSLENILGSLIYISGDAFKEISSMTQVEEISRRLFRINGSVSPGRIDNLISKNSNLYGGYEDEGTWEEMKGAADEQQESEKGSFCPALVVAIPEMPKGALVELEIVAVTAAVARHLESSSGITEMSSCPSIVDSKSKGRVWDSGHDFPTPRSDVLDEFRLSACARAVGKRCAAIALVVASRKNEFRTQSSAVHHSSLISDMISSVEAVLSNARAGLSLNSTTVHIRLFYVATENVTRNNIVVKDDGVALRSALAAAVASKAGRKTPAMTVVPVQAIDTIGWEQDSVKETTEDQTVMFALQVLCLDPVHFETELWIHKDRHYM